MNRYSMFYTSGGDGELEEDPNGEYVLHSEAQTRIAQLEAAHAQLLVHYHAAAAIHSGDGKRITELEDALREVAYGELLDDVGNRNDNGLRDYRSMPPGGKQIATWFRRLDAALKGQK